MRIATLNRIREGKFKHLKSLPHRKMCEIFKSLKIKYVEEKIVDFWSFDIYLPSYDIYIEVDGDYFHSNPLFYPSGPKTNTQKINYYRDLKKNQFCLKNNLTLLRFWEADILGNSEKIICKLKKLLKLEK